MISPRPWKIGSTREHYGNKISDSEELDRILDANNSEVIGDLFMPEDQPGLLEDVKHIIRCVNTHDELVAALKDAADALMDEIRWQEGLDQEPPEATIWAYERAVDVLKNAKNKGE